jgi:2-polyprenyl-6-methoxyphenol hydroxylase-like FAD-dependent oxidoreductase
MYTYARVLPVVEEIDVLVCGAGCAGIGAAIAAARMGVRVHVVERMGFAGGFLTAIVGAGLDGMFDDTTGQIVVGGVAMEIVERMGMFRGDWFGTRFNRHAEQESQRDHPERVTLHSDPEKLKRAADTLLTEAGVGLAFHTQIVDVEMRGERIDAVIVADKGGLRAIRAAVVVDCTGDGDVAAWAGAPFERSDNAQPGSLHFRIGGVRVTWELRQQMSAVIAAAHAEGRLGNFGGPWLAAFAPDDLYVNAVRLTGDGTDPAWLTGAEMQGRRDAWTMFEEWQRALPEFADAHFITSGPNAGLRETRRIRGHATLTAEDVRTGRAQEDVVCRGCWPLDRHPRTAAGHHTEPRVPPYDIAYRTLLPQGVENLLVAGRCHSATSEAAASSRVTITAMGMGQGAGVAAALAARDRIAPDAVSIPSLQRHLREQGVLLD